MYDLAVDGVAAFYQRRPGARKLVRREPAVGQVDGSNVIFLLSQPPVLYDSVVLYDADAPLTPLSPVMLDPDGGVFQLAGAPNHQVLADYTAVPLYTRQVVYIAYAGFQLMEGLWARGLALSSDHASYVQAGQDDSHLYIVTRSGPDVADPVCGSLTFSTSVQQKALLARCIEMAFLSAMASEAAMSDVAIRERLGGVSVDPTKRTSNLLAAKDSAWKELVRALESAQEEFYGEAGINAALADMPSTVEYEARVALAGEQRISDQYRVDLMLKYSNRNAHAPIREWANVQQHRCSAHIASEAECPADDCGWDELHQAAIKTDCLTCHGVGRIITFNRFELHAIPVWGADKFNYLVPTPGMELGDCTLGIDKSWEWLIQRILDSKRSYLIVDEKTLRPVVMTPNIVPQIGEGYLVTCKLYTSTNDS